MMDTNVRFDTNLMLPAGEEFIAYMNELEELDQTLAEMRMYVERYPEDEMGVLHLQQFELKRAVLAGERAMAEPMVLACSIDSGAVENYQFV
ncbi:hypothetical protein M3223_11935 [Paenibacillus pasadenensis]|uniref:hypothetical protein n=1 Tax=Paenibacillus pasadenensis TaxID=217090 RepID=UPI00203CC63C|nr:hypothetical protein [Paenibacillus pasadenensis]MCM3748063.1 hypothetical protein [Paenibacillus pasadenensis]